MLGRHCVLRRSSGHGACQSRVVVDRQYSCCHRSDFYRSHHAACLQYRAHWIVVSSELEQLDSANSARSRFPCWYCCYSGRVLQLYDGTQEGPSRQICRTVRVRHCSARRSVDLLPLRTLLWRHYWFHVFPDDTGCHLRMELSDQPRPRSPARVDGCSGTCIHYFPYYLALDEQCQGLPHLLKLQASHLFPHTRRVGKSS